MRPGILAAALVVACSEKAPAPAPSASAVVTRGDFTRELLLTGELEAVRSVSIKGPQTSLFQLRIQFMAEEGTVVKAGEPLLSFDDSSLAAQVLDLETRILDAETRILAKRSELQSALKDLEIELAEREFAHGRSQLYAAVEAEVLSRKKYNERQLAFAKAERELAETHARIALTRERGTSDLDVLTIERDKLRADLRSAENDLELLIIAAPDEGLVVYEKRQGTTLRYQEGDSCWPGQGLIRLPDLTAMQVLFAVSEVDAPSLRVGMPVAVTLDAFPGRRLGGEIEHIPSMAVKRSDDSKVAVFKIRARLDETWVGEMKPGMSVRGRVVVDRRQGVPLIMRDAVRLDDEGYWLEVAGGEATQFEPLAGNARHYVIDEALYARLGGAGGGA